MIPFDELPDKVQIGARRILGPEGQLKQSNPERFEVHVPGKKGMWAVYKRNGHWRCNPCQGGKTDEDRPCQHIVAVLVHLKLLPLPEPAHVALKGDGPRNWSAINQARDAEPTMLPKLLAELVATVPDKPVKCFGRPPARLRDLLYASLVYVNEKRSMAYAAGMLKSPLYREHVWEPLSYGVLSPFLSDPGTKEILERLLAISAAPAKLHVKCGGPDGTGFQQFNFYNYAERRVEEKLRNGEKPPGQKDPKKGRRRHHISAIAFVMNEICVVPALVVKAKPAKLRAQGKSEKIKETEKPGESPWFLPLAERTRMVFPALAQVSADMGFLKTTHYLWGKTRGIDVQIPRRQGTGVEGGHRGLARKAMMDKFREYELDPEGHKRKYYQREIQEAVMNAVKAVFGGGVRCRDHVAQENEVRLKWILHNLRVLIFERFNRDLKVDFAAEAYAIDAQTWVTLEDLKLRYLQNNADHILWLEGQAIANSRPTTLGDFTGAAA